ncbi:MAG: hypothetical protein OQK76_03395, partial [Gammaproteobacteria bacterium]|nr:hypothetical protein [Gammaproteobacteria bacterium]
KKYLFLISMLLLSACSTDDQSLTTNADVIVTGRASDYSSGAYSAVTEDSINSFSSLNELSATTSDVFAAAYGGYFYFFNKTDASITKYAFSDATTAIWQFSVNDPADTGANPYAMVFVNATKAYILRYGKTTAWIVNPSATTEGDFKIGELDLGAYADGDGLPEMANGVIANGKLFVVMQRLEYWSPTITAYVAVFDTATDVEIDAGYPGDAVNGIPLEIRNPNTDIVYEPTNNKIYIQGFGDYSAPKFTGGIESIDPDTYSTVLELDDGDETTHIYGQISGLAVHSSTLAYFVGYLGWGDNYLYAYNPSTGAIQQSSVSGLQGINIASIAFDANGRLWVADATNATVHIVDGASDTLLDSVSTVLSPINIVFAE